MLSSRCAKTCLRPVTIAAATRPAAAIAIRTLKRTRQIRSVTRHHHQVLQRCVSSAAMTRPAVLRAVASKCASLPSLRRPFSQAAVAQATPVDQLFNRVAGGMSYMIELNENFSVTKDGSNELHIGTDQASFRLLSRSDGSIDMQSPYSGAHSYTFDEANRRWACSRDDHDLVELLSRELVENFSGYPSF